MTLTSGLAECAARVREFITRRGSDGDAAIRDGGESEFNVLALELFSVQFLHNAAYRRWIEAREVNRGTMRPPNPSSWREIPAIPTAAFKELELTSLSASEQVAEFHSSGTTGQTPSRHFHSTDSLALYEASLWPWFRRHLLADSSAVEMIFLSPPPNESPHSSLVHMFDTVRRRAGGERSEFFGTLTAAGDWSLRFDSLNARADEAVAGGRPLAVLGTAFSFVHWLDALEASGTRFALPPDSRVMETGGYKGRSRSLPKVELHARISEFLGVAAGHIVCEYGMSELSSQAYDRAIPPMRNAECGTRIESRSRRREETLTSAPFESCDLDCYDDLESPLEPRVFRFPPWCRPQVVSPETGREVADGETGLLRVCDLANVWSVLAVQTEDLAIRRGSGFELLGRAPATEPRGCSLNTADVGE